MKNHRKQLATYAQQGRQGKSSGGFDTFSFVMFQDPNHDIIAVPGNATKPNVIKQHQQALELFKDMADQLPTKEGAAVGQIIYTDGDGYEPRRRVIYEISTDETAKTVTLKNPTLHNDGMWHIHPIEKKHGIGTYYKAGETMEPSEIQKLIAQAKELAEKEAAELPAKKAAERAKQEAENEAVIKQYPLLSTEVKSGGVGAAKNLRIELKEAFPETKFSVTAEFDSIYINWNDGPAEKAVKEISDKYEDHVTDQSGDFRDCKPSIFNTLFGGCNFVFERRTITPAPILEQTPEPAHKSVIATFSI